MEAQGGGRVRAHRHVRLPEQGGHDRRVRGVAGGGGRSVPRARAQVLPRMRQGKLQRGQRVRLPRASVVGLRQGVSRGAGTRDGHSGDREADRDRSRRGGCVGRGGCDCFAGRKEGTRGAGALRRARDATQGKEEEG